MDRNIEGLKRSARLRSEGALAKATAALQRMETADQEINWINFRTVAEARVSTAWLYSQEELRFLIRRLRSSTSQEAPSVRISQDRERISRQKHRGDAAPPDQHS